MADRENVIKGLECCNMPNNHDDCPYNGAAHYNICTHQLLTDAIALLKEQEPRVMTLEEVKAAKGSDMYLEMRGYEDGNEYMTAATLDGVGTRGVNFYHSVFDFESYGKATIFGWRCWTARPTDEQREGTPWT